jgi:hypothetical protein
MKTSDYAKFTTAAKELGAERVKKIGRLDECVIVEAWYFDGPTRRKGEGFILMHNTSDGTIGVYEFVGKSGASVDDDIKWLMATYGRIAEGKAA